MVLHKDTTAGCGMSARNQLLRPDAEALADAAGAYTHPRSQLDFDSGYSPHARIVGGQLLLGGDERPMSAAESRFAFAVLGIAAAVLGALCFALWVWAQRGSLWQ